MHSSDTKHLKVWIESFRGRLRIGLPKSLFEGKQKYLSLSLDDSPDNRVVAEAKAKEIEADIFFDKFDASLVKYRPEGSTTQRPVSVEASVLRLPTQKYIAGDLKKCWEGWLNQQRAVASPSTKAKSYKTYNNYFSSLPHHDPSRALEIKDWCIENIPSDSCKRFITRLSAACDWGLERNYISDNPFRGMSKKIKTPKWQEVEDDADIQPFSAEQRDLIIQAIRENTFSKKMSRFKHSYYADFVEFLFLTGCRPSEAIALRKKHIKGAQIVFEVSVVAGEEGLVEKKGLKTQASRKFPINSKLSLLLDRVCEAKDANDLLFPSPGTKGWINTNNLAKRLWAPVLEGLSMEYRRMYQTRHTFITLMVYASIPPHQIAKWCGNSAEVILKHYVGVLDHVQVPEV